MFKTSMFVVAFGMMVGCGGDKLEKGLKDFKDQMCACKDLACADKVHEAYKKWENDVLEPEMKGKKESDISSTLINLDKERKDCRRKLRDADTGGGAAPAGGSAAPAAPTP